MMRQIEPGLARWIGAPLLVALAGLAQAQAASPQTPATPDTTEAARGLVLKQTPEFGDFDGMFEKRTIRVLIPYSRTLYFSDKGRERGMTAETMREFEQYLNKKYRKKLARRPLTVLMIPTTRDRLLGDVAAGLGDIAAGNLTVTPERQQTVDFIWSSKQRPVAEVIVTGPQSLPVASVEDLSGRSVDVRRSSSYYESLVGLNARFEREGKPPVQLVLLPEALEDEDILELVSAGVIDITVVDDWVAGLWARVLPKLKVHNDISVRAGGKTGWAIRKDSPLLAAEVTAFCTKYLEVNRTVEARLARYHKRIKLIHDPTKSQEWKRFQETLAVFERYGARYHFDPLMLTAQGYQESALNQSARSPVGAVGIMQVMPDTGAELKVGDITITENNIHAGTKYMDRLMTQYFKDAEFDDHNRVLFAFASYNAGPGRISSMRRLAEKRGFDPNQWFNNVEIVTAERVGWETTTYVRNILKYYVAYKLALDAQAALEKAHEQLKGGAG